MLINIESHIKIIKYHYTQASKQANENEIVKKRKEGWTRL